MQYNRANNALIRPPLSPWIPESTLGSGSNFFLLFDFKRLFLVRFSFSGTYGVVECVRHINTRQRLARKTIKLTSKQEEENELPATAVREIAVLKSIQQENIIKFVDPKFNLM